MKPIKKQGKLSIGVDLGISYGSYVVMQDNKIVAMGTTCLHPGQITRWKAKDWSAASCSAPDCRCACKECHNGAPPADRAAESPIAHLQIGRALRPCCRAEVAGADALRPIAKVRLKPLQFAKYYNIHNAAMDCTAYGKGEALLSTCPTHDGRGAYVWRMARFHSGADTSMPVSVMFRLSDTIKEATGVEISCGIIGPLEKEICDYLDGVVDQLLEKLGLSKNGAVHAWRGLLGR